MEITKVKVEDYFIPHKAVILPLYHEEFMNENLKETIADAVDILALSKAVFGDGVQVTDVFQLPKFLELGKDLQAELDKAIGELKHLSPEAAIDTLQFLLEKIKGLLK